MVVFSLIDSSILINRSFRLVLPSLYRNTPVCIQPSYSTLGSKRNTTLKYAPRGTVTLSKRIQSLRVDRRSAEESTIFASKMEWKTADASEVERLVHQPLTGR